MFRAESLELLARRPRSRKTDAAATVAADEERLLDSNESEVPPPGAEDPDDAVDPDDCGPRLVVGVAEPDVEKSYILPALPTPSFLLSEMPSSWWEALLFGKPDNVVGLEDSQLVIKFIGSQLADDHDSGHLIKRDPGVNGEAQSGLPATVGALHERIYELYGDRGWRVFQRLYHEAAGLRPERHKTVEAINVITNNDAPPLNSHDAIEPGLANAIIEAPIRVQRFLLTPPRDLPRWRTSLPPPGMDDGAWVG
jgi:hypothetical protein